MASSIEELEEIPIETTDSPSIQSLPELLTLLKSEAIDKKLSAIKDIGKLLQSDERDFDPSEFKQAIESLIDCITNNHCKVAELGLQTIGNIIVIYTKQMLSYADQLAPKVLFTMSDKREPVTNASNFVFQLMHTNYGPDKLMPSFIKCLEPSHIMRIKAGALEVMNMLIKEAETYFTNEGNVKLCTQKAIQMINDNFKNKKIILPALGVLLALRDKNYNTTLSSILSVSEIQLSKVKSLAHECAQDLEENIESYKNIAPPVTEPTKIRKPIIRKEGSVERPPVKNQRGVMSKPGSAVKPSINRSTHLADH